MSSCLRRRFVLVFAGSVACTLATTPARAQRRGPLGWADLDRDGTITREEFDQVRTRRFDRLDANKDGVVTREEFMAVDAPAFERLDRNKDGKITPEEMPRRRGNR
ncbi:MAG: EF-hand domain-containing protein [Geminicoccaceae bacterium]|nr:EF-hand domain-containing protein [Geminicoccaceae bacterium]MDW8370460.1 EF-hand domain-containing protein [Geminicoccaceae bacterium]